MSTTLYDDVQNIIAQNVNISILVNEINLTTHTTQDIINNTIVPNLANALSNTTALLDKWGDYNASALWEKTGSVETKVDTMQAWLDAFNTTEQQRYSDVMTEISDTQVILSALRDELNFTGKNITAYQYLVNLESQLTSVNSSLWVKIATEGNLTREQIIEAIMANTTAILSAISDNQNSLNTILNNWDNITMDSLMGNVTDVRTRVINLQSWMDLFNATEATRHATSQSLVNDVLAWLGLFNTTEAERHNLTQTKIDNVQVTADDIRDLTISIITQLGYNATNHTARNDTVQLMNLIAVLTEMVGNITDIDYIDLVVGINAVALPKQPSNISIEYVMSNITGNFTRVDYWDEVSSTWLVYNVDAPFGNTLTNMTTQKVYWIYANATSRLYIN
jgi:hypothetical protein